MSLINRDYFIGPINVANRDDTSVAESLDFFIDVHESTFLERCLGYEFKKLFLDGLGQVSIDQRWLDLKNGKEYTFNGKTKKWGGFVRTAPARLESPIANYVYFWYSRDLQTQTTTTGEVNSNTENSQQDSPNLKTYTAWSKMREQLVSLKEFLTTNQADVYPEWTFIYHDWLEFGPINPIGI